MNYIRKFHIRNGLTGERLEIRAFKFADDMHKFLNKRDNALSWAEIELPANWMKSAGMYARVAGKWTNVKSIDPALLSHV